MKRILVISGNLPVQNFLGGYLKRNGFEIEMAESQISGLELLNTLQVSLAINDLGKENNGQCRSLIDEWHASTLSQSLPTIFLSENATPLTTNLIQQARYCWLLFKPFDEKELLDLVEEALCV